MPIRRRKLKAKAVVASSKSELNHNNQPSKETSNSEHQRASATIEGFDSTASSSQEEPNKKLMAVEMKQINEADNEGAGGVSHHDENKQEPILEEEIANDLNEREAIDASECKDHSDDGHDADELRSEGESSYGEKEMLNGEGDVEKLAPSEDKTHIVEEQAASELNNERVVEASTCKGNEEISEELVNDKFAEDIMSVGCGENVGKVKNEETEMDSVSEDKKNNMPAFICEQGVDEALVVSEVELKKKSLVDVLPHQDLGKEKVSCTESLSNAVAVNDKDESGDGDAKAADEVRVPTKVLKIKKVIRKKKLVKGKAVAVKDECKLQLAGSHNPVFEERTNEIVKNELGNSSLLVSEEKDTQQSTGKVAVRDDSTPGKSKTTEAAGKGKKAPESKNVDDVKGAKSGSIVKKLGKMGGREVEKSNVEKKIAKGKDMAEPSAKHKSSDKTEEMGMIFMCSSKTKEECYRSKIFGLPANKRDEVLKVYEGMRLFLFDFDLKLLYGIYKAAGPGGYNIEPNAFRSGFPSQVRFTIVHDCLPLTEEKFKNAIKDNYYTKNKFKCELNSEQVENLCKLFLATSEGTKSKAVLEKTRVGPPSIAERRKKKRARAGNDLDHVQKKKRTEVDTVRNSKKRARINHAGPPRATGDARRLQTEGVTRRPRIGGDTRRPRDVDDARPSWAKGDARRSRAEAYIRRSRAKVHSRFPRAEADARAPRDGAHARRLRAEDDAKRSRFEEDAARFQADEDARRFWAEEDARRIRAEEDARHSRRHPDVYERESYMPPTRLMSPRLVALTPAEMPPYTPSYAYGRTSTLLDDYRQDLGTDHLDRGVAYPRSQYLREIEHLDPYARYRDPIAYRDPGCYPPIATRDEHLPSAGRTSVYRDPRSPYRRY